MAVPEEARRDVFSRIKKDISAQALSEWFLNWITSLTLRFHWRALRNRGNARTPLERTCWQAEGGAQCFSLARCLPGWQEAASGSLSLWLPIYELWHSVVWWKCEALRDWNITSVVHTNCFETIVYMCLQIHRAYFTNEGITELD